jgi:Putative bacterial sensory transduction regulator
VRATTREDVHKVEGHLQKLGWPVISLSPGTWRSSFRSNTGVFPLVIQVDDGWCKLLVLPIVRLPGDVEKAEKLYLRLLKLNGELLLARFSLDEDGDVILSVELPLSDLDASEIKDSLDVLSVYAERFQGELRQLVV